MRLSSSHSTAILFTALIISPASGEELTIELSSASQGLTSAIISSGETEIIFRHADSLYRFQSDAQWFGDRAIVEATIVPTYATSNFSLDINTYRCVTAWGCEIRKVELPPPLGSFDFDEVQLKCSEQRPAMTREKRIAKYLFCRESFLIMQQQGADDARAYPTSSFALWGWYKSAFQLFTIYRYHGVVPFFRWDETVDGLMREKISSSEADAFLRTLSVDRKSIEEELDQLNVVSVERLQYAQQLINSGEISAARGIISDVSATIDRQGGSLNQSDLQYLATLRSLVGLD
jgi:hypothetical protein